jgi:hypothetical protein
MRSTLKALTSGIRKAPTCRRFFRHCPSIWGMCDHKKVIGT